VTASERTTLGGLSGCLGKQAAGAPRIAQAGDVAQANSLPGPGVGASMLAALVRVSAATNAPASTSC